MAAFAISQSSSLLPDSTKANDAAASVFAIIDRKSKIDPSDESGVTLDNVVGEIELHGVSFCYPSRPDVQIFHNLNLTIHSEKVKKNNKIFVLCCYLNCHISLIHQNFETKFFRLLHW